MRDLLTANGRLVAALAAGALVVGTVLEYREVVVLGLALAAAFGGFVRLGRPPTLDVHRELLPGRVVEGESAHSVVTVTNTGARRTLPLVATEHHRGEAMAVALPALAPGARHRTTYELATGRRGLVPVGPLQLSSSDPFRLFQAVLKGAARTTLVVHPRTVAVSIGPSGLQREIDGGPTRARQGGGVAFHSLRQYVPGDDLRLIHWRSSARTGSLLVRHNVVTSQPRLLIVLDVDAASYDDSAHVDDAVRVAASLGVAGVHEGYPTEVVTTNGARARVPLTAKGKPGTAILDLLAAAQLDRHGPGLGALLHIADGSDTALIVVTGHPRAERASAVSRVRRRVESVTVVQLRAGGGRPALPILGARVVACADAAAFPRAWHALVAP
jgi:uncharacterized protein (DUF58 family)